MLALIGRVARSIPLTFLAVALLSAVGILVGFAFRMSIGGAIAIYYVVWWTALFCILPVRVSTQADEGAITAGTVASAPAYPALCERAIWTTIVSDIVFAAVAAFFPLAGV